MDNQEFKKSWIAYRDKELEGVKPILQRLGFELDKKQVHISGERYLSGNKLVLIGKRIKDNKKVVIKVSSDPVYIKEIAKEEKNRKILEKINFAYNIFFYPKVIISTKEGAYIIFITEFIDQKCAFIERPLKEQFFLILKVFEAQESIHITTYEHAKLISRSFGVRGSGVYLDEFIKNIHNIRDILADDGEMKELLSKAEELLIKNVSTIELYCNFLTHWDLVPHNFRIRNNNVYLLDHSSLRFGNKYEGWARFINFMTIYNPELEKALLDYVKDNRDEREMLSLKLMRVYRLSEHILYYINLLQKSVGNLYNLNKTRIDFLSNLLEAILDDKKLDRDVVEEYKKIRDSLRSEEEKQRQIGLH